MSEDQPCERCHFVSTPGGKCLCREVAPVTFAVYGEPASKARARFTRYGSSVRAYTPEKTMQAERAVAEAYLAVAEPTTDVDVAFGVKVEFRHETGQRRDVDNMLKMVLDALNGIAWPDDVQVTRIEAMKTRVPKGEAETRVTISNLGRVQKPRGRCLQCGAEFMMYASTSSRKFCSQACGYAHRVASRQRSCEQCGGAFLAWGASSETRFCSIACNSAHKRVTLTCVQCGEAFTKQRSIAHKGHPLCSPECRALYHREARKCAAKGTCQDCGGPTTKKTYKRCRGCNFAAGGRWADKGEVTCPTCHSFVREGVPCRRESCRAAIELEESA